MLRKYEKNKINRFRTFALFRNFVGNSGFTLIEALTSATIFAITMTSIVGVYISVQRLNQTSAAVQSVQENGRFLIEDLTKMIRNGAIDYSRYGATVPQPHTTNLYILDQNGEQVAITYDSFNGLVINRGSLGSSVYSSNEVSITDFKAYIWPETNPIPLGTHQPTLTIYFNIRSNINTRDIINIPFQTTVATRQYD